MRQFSCPGTTDANELLANSGTAKKPHTVPVKMNLMNTFHENVKCRISKKRNLRQLLCCRRPPPAKLRELNAVAPQEHKLSEEFVESLEGMLVSVVDGANGANNSTQPPTLQQINLLWKAAHWPEGTPHRKTMYAVWVGHVVRQGKKSEELCNSWNEQVVMFINVKVFHSCRKYAGTLV